MSAEILLPPDTEFVPISDIPRLIAEALNPDASGRQKTVSYFMKYSKEEASEQTRNWHGWPIDDDDRMQLLDGPWSHLPPFPDEATEADARPYIEAANAQAAGLDWEIVPCWLNYGLNADVLRHNSEQEHRKFLDMAIMRGRLKAVAPHSRIPVQIARDDAEVAVTDFADYATQFHIQVRVDSSGPLRSFPSSPAASLAFDSENNTNRMGMTTTEIKLLNWPLRNKGMDQFSKWLSSPRKWLNEARLTRGGPGQKNPATWNPVLVAIALIDKGYADLTAIDRFIRSDVSNWVPEWEEKKDQLWG